MFKDIDTDQELTWLNKFNDVNTTLESIEELSSYAQDTINTRASSITPELVNSIRATGTFLVNELNINCKAIGVDSPDGTRISLESIDDKTPKVALEGIVDSIKKGIKFILNLILTGIKKVLNLLRITTLAFFSGIFTIFNSIRVAVGKVSNWKKGAKIKGDYHFEDMDSIILNYGITDKVIEILLSNNNTLYTNLKKFKKLIKDGDSYFNQAYNGAVISDLKKQDKLFDDTHKEFLATLSHRFATKGSVVNIDLKTGKMTQTIHPPRYKGKIPDKKKFLKVLEGLEKAKYPSEIDSIISLNNDIKSLLEDILLVLRETTFKGKDVEKAAAEVMTTIKWAVEGSSSVLIIINSIFKLIGVDVIKISSKVKDLDLPDDFKDQVKKAYK